MSMNQDEERESLIEQVMSIEMILYAEMRDRLTFRSIINKVMTIFVQYGLSLLSDFFLYEKYKYKKTNLILECSLIECISDALH